jgi:hypothetical protein
MEIIAHRRNTTRLLQDTKTEHGVEMDLRSVGDRLIVQHDPFLEGEAFEAWLQGYKHGTLIVNVKEEGLEARAKEALMHSGIENFFFLDQSFPFLVKSARAGEKRCAVRVSEHESIETALALAGMVKWVWVDCFTRLPLSRDDASRLIDADFSLCFVSPELQGRTNPVEISAYRREVESLGIEIAAVCTKEPLLWS